MAHVEINIAAPRFTMMDYEGNLFALAEKKDKENVLLVFNRGFL